MHRFSFISNQSKIRFVKTGNNHLLIVYILIIVGRFAPGKSKSTDRTYTLKILFLNYTWTVYYILLIHYTFKIKSSFHNYN